MAIKLSRKSTVIIGALVFLLFSIGTGFTVWYLQDTGNQVGSEDSEASSCGPGEKPEYEDVRFCFPGSECGDNTCGGSPGCGGEDSEGYVQRFVGCVPEGGDDGGGDDGGDDGSGGGDGGQAFNHVFYCTMDSAGDTACNRNNAYGWDDNTAQVVVGDSVPLRCGFVDGNGDDVGRADGRENTFGESCQPGEYEHNFNTRCSKTQADLTSGSARIKYINDQGEVRDENEFNNNSERDEFMAGCDEPEEEVVSCNRACNGTDVLCSNGLSCVSVEPSWSDWERSAVLDDVGSGEFQALTFANDPAQNQFLRQFVIRGGFLHNREYSNGQLQGDWSTAAVSSFDFPVSGSPLQAFDVYYHDTGSGSYIEQTVVQNGNAYRRNNQSGSYNSWSEISDFSGVGSGEIQAYTRFDNPANNNTTTEVLIVNNTWYARYNESGSWEALGIEDDLPGRGDYQGYNIYLNPLTGNVNQHILRNGSLYLRENNISGNNRCRLPSNPDSITCTPPVEPEPEPEVVLCNRVCDNENLVCQNGLTCTNVPAGFGEWQEARILEDVGSGEFQALTFANDPAQNQFLRQFVIRGGFLHNREYSNGQLQGDWSTAAVSSFDFPVSGSPLQAFDVYYVSTNGGSSTYIEQTVVQDGTAYRRNNQSGRYNSWLEINDFDNVGSGEIQAYNRFDNPANNNTTTEVLIVNNTWYARYNESGSWEALGIENDLPGRGDYQGFSTYLNPLTDNVNQHILRGGRVYLRENNISGTSRCRLPSNPESMICQPIVERQSLVCGQTGCVSDTDCSNGLTCRTSDNRCVINECAAGGCSCEEPPPPPAQCLDQCSSDSDCPTNNVCDEARNICVISVCDGEACSCSEPEPQNPAWSISKEGEVICDTAVNDGSSIVRYRAVVENVGDAPGEIESIIDTLDTAVQEEWINQNSIDPEATSVSGNIIEWDRTVEVNNGDVLEIVYQLNLPPTGNDTEYTNTITVDVAEGDSITAEATVMVECTVVEEPEEPVSGTPTCGVTSCSTDAECGPGLSCEENGICEIDACIGRECSCVITTPTTGVFDSAIGRIGAGIVLISIAGLYVIWDGSDEFMWQNVTKQGRTAKAKREFEDKFKE